jgi:polar amino acid transport system substrate-binding protein
MRGCEKKNISKLFSEKNSKITYYSVMTLNSIFKKILYFGSIILFVVLMVMGVRACMRYTHFGEEVYLIAYDKTWYPTDLRGREPNMVAFTMDLMKAIAVETDFEVKFIEVGSGSLYEGLDDRYYSAVISSKIPNIVNRREYDFSDAIYPLGPVLVVKMDSTFSDVSDLKGRIIGVEVGTQQLYQIIEESDFIMIPYQNIPAALESLERNGVDAVIMDVLPAYIYTQGYYKGRLRVATSPLLDAGIRLVTLITPHNQGFLEEFNRGLKQIKDEGIYDKLLKKWDLVKTELPPPKKEKKRNRHE